MRDLTIAVGRPMVHDLPAMCDAVAYVVKNGVEWRRARLPPPGGGCASSCAPWRDGVNSPGPSSASQPRSTRRFSFERSPSIVDLSVRSPAPGGPAPQAAAILRSSKPSGISSLLPENVRDDTAHMTGQPASSQLSQSLQKSYT